VHYFRQVDAEPPVRQDYEIVYFSKDLLVVDKPPNIPVTPGGLWVDNCLLRLLQRDFGDEELTPLHRLDRLTSGLVLFSRRKDSRRILSRLFQPEQLIKKEYLAVCELAGDAFPATLDLVDRIERSSREYWRQVIVNSRPANARCRAKLLFRADRLALYRVFPESGKKHQIRVQLAYAGLPILGDPLYGLEPSYRPGDLFLRLFLDAARVLIPSLPPQEAMDLHSGRTPRSFFETALARK